MSDSFYGVPRGTIEKYIDLLNSWNQKINLVAYKDKEELLYRHILDSLQLMRYLNKDAKIVDIGSGAGFPGLMLSYAGVKEVNLVEVAAKKASFLLAASTLSIESVKIYNKRVEQLEICCNVITARGLASLDEIFTMTRALTTKQTRFLLLKGKKVDQEIKKALEKWKFKYILYPSATSEEGYVLEVEQLKKNE